MKRGNRDGSSKNISDNIGNSRHNGHNIEVHRNKKKQVAFREGCNEETERNRNEEVYGTLVQRIYMAFKLV